jgi:hypothetical protein
MNSMTMNATAEQVMPLDPVALTELQTIGGGSDQASGPVASIATFGGSLNGVVRPPEPPPPFNGHFRPLALRL